MVTLPVTLTPKLPQFVHFAHIFVVGVVTDFKFGSKSPQPADNSSLKGAWSLACDILEIYTPEISLVRSKLETLNFIY